MNPQAGLEDPLAPPRHTPAARRHSLLSLDPDFGGELAPELWRSLHRTMLVAVENYECGAWQPATLASPASHVLALLVVDGLLLREVEVAGRTSAELLGAGDIIQLPGPRERALSPPAAWTALMAGHLALIDERLLAGSPGSLPLLRALASRCTQRGRALGALALTRTMRRTDERLLFLLTFLASRWGHMRADGIRLSLPAHHETLARLIGTRRQSVSTSLGQLRDRGLLRVLPDGDWLLTHSAGTQENVPIAPLPVLTSHRTVSLLDVDPQLAAHLPADQLAQAGRQAHAPARTLERGAWDATAEYGRQSGWLGLLITRGFLARRCSYNGETAIEILGPGDLLRPWDDNGEWLPEIETTWQALVPSEIALLDASFTQRIVPWPSLTAELLARAGRRARWLAAGLAVSQQTHTTARVMHLFSHLAERWGTGPDGLVIPLPLTHAQIGGLIGAQRPSVTAALGTLRRRRLLERLADGTWRIVRHGP